MDGRPWHLYPIAAVAVVVVVLAVTQIGAPTTAARTSRVVVTAQDGIVQTTVTGTGNVEAGSDVNANFQASGTLSQVFVHVGQRVIDGQLLATLDPTSAQLTLDQAQANLASAEDQLSSLENPTATTTSLTPAASSAEYVAYKRPPSARGRPTTTTTTTTTKPTSAPVAGSTRTTTSSSTGARAPSTSTTTTGSGTATTPTAPTSTPSPSSIASAQAALYSAQANVQSARQALAKTQLHAPASGTIVSLASLSPGDQIAAGASGTANAPATSGSSSSTPSAGSQTSTGSTAASSSASGNSSSGVPFAEIVDASTMTMTVSFSESDITKVKVGQPATVTIDALSGVELAAHVSSISAVGTTSSGVVSYDSTLTLNQTDARVKPGMSASASVIVGQAHGVTVPNQAVTTTGSLGTVQASDQGRTVPRQVIVGLRGDSRTQIISGLSSGQQVVVTVTLPSLGTSSSSTTPTSGTLGSGRFGGGGFFGRSGSGFRGAAGGGTGFGGAAGGGFPAAPGGG